MCQNVQLVNTIIMPLLLVWLVINLAKVAKTIKVVNDVLRDTLGILQPMDPNFASPFAILVNIIMGASVWIASLDVKFVIPLLFVMLVE